MAGCNQLLYVVVGGGVAIVAGVGRIDTSAVVAVAVVAGT